MRLLALLAAGLFAGTLIADDKKDKPKDDEAIVGVWRFESIDTGDEVTSGKSKELAKLQFTFKKGEAAIQFGGEEAKFLPFKLDGKADPKTMDINPDDAKQAMKFLYTLDGDTLVVCLKNGPAGADRPTEFKPNKGKSTALITLKRVKDEKKDK
jgi:uncharacterized protein (TIGR03067 family)